MYFRTLLIGIILASFALAQEYVPSFPKRSYFKNVFGERNTTVILQGPVKLQDYAVNGKLELSLRNYLDAVLANNTDIQIQKLQVEIPKNQITRAYSLFDPVGVASWNTTRTFTPTTSILQGVTSGGTSGQVTNPSAQVASTITSLTQPFSLTYQQLLPSGTQANVNFGATRNSNNNAFQLFNPAFSSNLGVNLAQPLLRNRGMAVIKLPITIARSRVRVAEFGVQDQILRLVTLAENAYWDVVSSRENLRVQEQALELARESLKRAQRELELGASSPLDIYQPQQQFATAEINVSQARYSLIQAEDILRRQMGADLDQELRKLPIVLTESVLPPTDLRQYDREELVQRALGMRPDLQGARQAIDVDDLQIRFSRNQLLPNVALTAQYGAFGRGGIFRDSRTIVNPDGSTSSLINTLPGGFGDSLGQLFGFGFPTYGFGLTITLPIRDHAAQANLADAMVSKKLDTLTVRQTEQRVRQEVLNAVTQLENSRAGLQLAQVALDFAQKRVEAEQKKYDLGTTTIFFLLAAQNDLTFAQLNVVNQSIGYRRNQLNLLQRTGDLLTERNLLVK